jgi:hypothetical protein
MKHLRLILVIGLAGCASVRQENNRLLECTAAVVKIPTARLQLDERVEQTRNIYYSVSTADGRGFRCVVNGDRRMPAGTGNVPQCIAKGDPRTSVGESTN